jgi:hypothetical protein
VVRAGQVCWNDVALCGLLCGVEKSVAIPKFISKHLFIGELIDITNVFYRQE